MCKNDSFVEGSVKGFAQMHDHLLSEVIAGGSRYAHISMIQSLPENLNRRSLSIVMGMREIHLCATRPVTRKEPWMVSERLLFSARA